jgi:O-antigen/teichoic acid export membrane protein
MLTPLVTMPLALNYLGDERYGMWQTIGSVVGMMAFADLGLGNGLLTTIAAAAGREDTKSANRLVSSAFFTLAGVAGGLLLAFFALSPLVDWPRFFNVASPLAKSEAPSAMAACAACFAIALPLGIVQKVQAGYQEGFRSNVWQCFGSVAALGFLVAAVNARVSLAILVLGLMGTPILLTGLNGVTYCWFQRPWLRPSWSGVDRPTAFSLLRTGSCFLSISVLMAIGLSSDNIVTAQVLGAEAVTHLAVPARMASPLAALAMMIYLPMWGANAEAIARGDIAWVKATFRRLRLFALLLTAVGGFVYVLCCPWVLRLMIGDRVAPHLVLLLGLGASGVSLAVAGPGFMVLNAAGVLRPQILMYLVFTVASIVAKVFLTARFGIDVIPWVTVCLYATFILLPLNVLINRTLKGLEAMPYRNSLNISARQG